MPSIQLRLDKWGNDAVKFALAELKQEITDAAYNALLAQAEVMKGYWQIYIQVETGSARDSIRVERGGVGVEWRKVSVRGGGYVVNPKTGRLVDYMHWLEQKYGAGHAAFYEVKPTIAAMIEAEVVNRVG